jgi:hypothetical protein
VPWLRSLVAGLSPRSPGFAPGSIHVGFVVDKVALGQGFLRPLSVSFHRRSPTRPGMNSMSVSGSSSETSHQLVRRLNPSLLTCAVSGLYIEIGMIVSRCGSYWLSYDFVPSYTRNNNFLVFYIFLVYHSFRTLLVQHVSVYSNPSSGTFVKQFTRLRVASQYALHWMCSNCKIHLL